MPSTNESPYDLGLVFVLDIVGDLTSETLAAALRVDIQVRGLRTEAAVDDRPPRVLVRIASRGGETDIGAAIFQMLTMMPAEIVTLALGSISSAATIVFCAGSLRLLANQTRVVFHAPRWNPEGSYTVEEQRNVLKVSERRFELAASILSTTTGRDIDMIASELATGRVFTAEEAVAVRLATAVVSRVEFEPRQIARN